MTQTTPSEPRPTRTTHASHNSMRNTISTVGDARGAHADAPKSLPTTQTGLALAFLLATLLATGCASGPDPSKQRFLETALTLTAEPKPTRCDPLRPPETLPDPRLVAVDGPVTDIAQGDAYGSWGLRLRDLINRREAEIVSAETACTERHVAALEAHAKRTAIRADLLEQVMEIGAD